MTTRTRGASAQTVLLLSPDVLGAALLGMLAELVGYKVAFAEPGERPEDALSRVKPLFVVLLDASMPVVSSDLFFGRAAGRRVGVAILRRPGSDLAVAQLASSRDVPCLDVPTDLDQFARVVEAASASNWWRAAADRRRTPHTELAADGTLVYLDRTGRRWRVYDRRGADRRQRLFMDESGAMWHYNLDADDGASSPTELERQLAHAVKDS